MTQPNIQPLSEEGLNTIIFIWGKREPETHVITDIKRLIATIRAKEEELKASNLCDVCLGRPLESGKECICKGRGTSGEEKVGLRLAIHDLQQQLTTSQAKVKELESSKQRTY